MYIIYRIDKDEDGFNKSVAGVVNGDEAEALIWIRQNDKHLIPGRTEGNIIYPYYKQEYAKELKPEKERIQEAEITLE